MNIRNKLVLTCKWTQMDPFGPKTGQQAGQNVLGRNRSRILFI